MHYSNLVIIEKCAPEEVESAVENAMGAPEGKGGFWDWYQIGGRWTGAFDGYDPEADPSNIVECDLCGGTGVRRDAVGVSMGMVERGTCNGCQGKGKHATWPTQWGTHAGDIMPIANLTEEQLDKFFRIVTPYGRTFGGEDYLPWKEDSKGAPDYDAMFPRREKPPLEWLKKEYEGHLVVVVDNHS